MVSACSRWFKLVSARFSFEYVRSSTVFNHEIVFRSADRPYPKSSLLFFLLFFEKLKWIKLFFYQLISTTWMRFREFTGNHLLGSCVVFLVHGTILQQWTSLLKNPASIEKIKNLASECWTIVPVTVEELCQWLLNNCANHCWIIVPVTVEQSCQWLLNNRASDC